MYRMIEKKIKGRRNDEKKCYLLAQVRRTVVHRVRLSSDNTIPKMETNRHGAICGRPLIVQNYKKRNFAQNYRYELYHAFACL